MAVITIGKIQVRRGKKHDGTGVPQLSSGEFGWALDARELYIGNGSTSNGAPAIGNTRILTEYDNLFDLANQYVYRKTDGLLTGPNSSIPTQRSIQDRLDENVSVLSFGAMNDGSTDNTESLQRMLNELYLINSSLQNRVVVFFPPGTYNISDTLRVPPHVCIIGSGVDRTVIEQTSPGIPVLKTVGSDGDELVQNDTYESQCHNVGISDITFNGVENSPVLLLENCRNSNFANIKVAGVRASSTFNNNEAGIILRSVSEAVGSHSNIFDKCIFEDLTYGVKSDSPSRYNKFSQCLFSGLGYGVVFGQTLPPGDTSSPYANSIINSKFSDIERHGFWVNVGSNNCSDGNWYYNVGNEGSNDLSSVYPVIEFTERNFSRNDWFSRNEANIVDDGSLDDSPYVTAVRSTLPIESLYLGDIDLPQSEPGRFIRLPYNEYESYKLEYKISGISFTGTQIGDLKILSNETGVELRNNYEYYGDPVGDNLVVFSENVVEVDSTSKVLYININALDEATQSVNITFKVQKF